MAVVLTSTVVAEMGIMTRLKSKSPQTAKYAVLRFMASMRVELMTLALLAPRSNQLS